MVEEATSLSVCMIKDGEAEININVMLTTMSLNDTMAQGKYLKILC